MAVHSGTWSRPRRLSRWWLALGCAVLGGGLAILLAAAFGYGWFAGNTASGQTSRLAPGEAERIARGFAVQELRLVQEASRAEQRLPGSPTASDTSSSPTNGSVARLALEQSKFMAPTGSIQKSAGAATTATGGAWLFVFRASGIEVEEWRTSDAVLEVTVVISDVSGRLLQTGTTLLPRADDNAGSVR